MSLSAGQRLAIELLASGASVADAAAAAEVTTQTVYRWRRQQAFAQALEDLQAEVDDAAAHRLRALGVMALDVLAEMARDSKTPATARVRVCERLLELSQLRPADRSKDISDMDRDDVVELVASLPPDVVRDALERQGAA